MGDGVVRGTESEAVSNDQLYDLLADTRRRYALHYLKQSAEPVDVGELAEHVAAWENDKPVEELSSQDRKRVYISLYQSHLPTLDENGLVDYDDDRGRVELTETMADVDIYMEIVPDESIPWSYFYVGLSVASFLALGLVVGDVSVFETVPEAALAGVVVLVFSMSALVQTYERRRSRIGDDGPPPDLANR